MNRTVKVAVAVLGSLVLLVAGVAAYAAFPTTDGVVSACVTKPGGVIRIIDGTTQSCKKGEVSLNWNQQGVSGVSGFEVVEERQEDVTINGQIIGFSEGVACPEGKVAVGGGGQAHIILPDGSLVYAVAVANGPVAERFWSMTFHRIDGGVIPAGSTYSTILSVHCIAAS